MSSFIIDAIQHPSTDQIIPIKKLLESELETKNRLEKSLREQEFEVRHLQHKLKNLKVSRGEVV